MSRGPVAVRELMQLRSLGIDPASCRFGSVTVGSEKFIAVREEKAPQTGAPAVAIVQIQGSSLMRLPLPVDSAIMNPVSRVVGLAKADASNPQVTNLQIFNLDMKIKMKQAVLQGQLKFWKWLDSNTVAIVTGERVLHWSMDGNSEPRVMFDRTDTTSNVLNYRASTDGKWLLLCGLNTVNNVPTGATQFYSVENKQSQKIIPSTAACFVNCKVPGKQTSSPMFCFTTTAPSAKLNILEVGVPPNEAYKKQCDFPLANGDFPIQIIPDDKFGMVSLLTKLGQLLLFDVLSGTNIFQIKASDNFISASTESAESAGGMMIVDAAGRVAKIDIDEKGLIPHVANVLQNSQLAIQLSGRLNIGGDAASGLFLQQFQSLIRSQQTDAAIELASTSPGGALRNMDTINTFKQLDPQGGVLLKYFQGLLAKGSLNAVESVELVKLIIMKGNPQGIQAITGWIHPENTAKLQASEELGDVLKNANIKLALSIYLRANSHEKVVGCFTFMGAQSQADQEAAENFNNVLAYAARVNYTPDYASLISQMVRLNPPRAKDFAVMLMMHPDGAKLEVVPTMGIFLQMNDIKSATQVLYKYLAARGDREEDGRLQTQLFEMNLRVGNWQDVQVIMENPDIKFTHYDKLRIAQLCETGGLFSMALDNYNSIDDVKRVLQNAQRMSADPAGFAYLVNYFGRLETNDAIDILRDMMKTSAQKNLRIIVEVAKAWHGKFGAMPLIRIFEESQAFNGLFVFLNGDIVANSQDPAVVFKFVEAAVATGQFQDLERVCREHKYYDAKEVKEFLISRQIKNPLPLIHVCNQNGFIEELAQYLFQNQFEKHLVIYVQRLNSDACPQVLGTLLDMNAPEEFIRNLVQGVRAPNGSTDFVQRLVAEVEKRNRLKLIRPWIEERIRDGSNDVHLHTGLAKIVVDLNLGPQQFLRDNQFYDPKEVGRYCETRDPQLAMLVYRRAAANAADYAEDYIRVSSENGFFKDQAIFLVE